MSKINAYRQTQLINGEVKEDEIVLKINYVVPKSFWFDYKDLNEVIRELQKHVEKIPESVLGVRHIPDSDPDWEKIKSKLSNT